MATGDPKSPKSPASQSSSSTAAAAAAATTAATTMASASASGRPPTESNTDYRVVLFGSAGVGKSSLALRFVRNTFKDNYVPTIEDTYRQVITHNKVVCTLQITDTTGSHQFPAMQRLNIQKAHAFILVYSITNRQSLEELKIIYRDIMAIKGADSGVPMMLVGSKCDESAREVPAALAERLAQDWSCAYMETSAKANINVKEVFQELLKLDTRNTMLFNNDAKVSDKGMLASTKKKTNASVSSSKNGKDGEKGEGKRKCLIM